MSLRVQQRFMYVSCVKGSDSFWMACFCSISSDSPWADCLSKIKIDFQHSGIARGGARRLFTIIFFTKPWARYHLDTQEHASGSPSKVSFKRSCCAVRNLTWCSLFANTWTTKLSSWPFGLLPPEGEAACGHGLASGPVRQPDQPATVGQELA